LQADCAAVEQAAEQLGGEPGHVYALQAAVVKEAQEVD